MDGSLATTAPTASAPAGPWWSRSFEIPRGAWVEILILALVCLGLSLRYQEWFRQREYYLDEYLLLENLVDWPIWDLKTPMINDQVVPPGFLVVERMMVRLPFHYKLSARLIPLVCGLASVFLFVGLAKRCASPWGVAIAMAFFALGDSLLYYSSELKPYSLDVALATAMLLLTAGGRETDTPKQVRRRWLALAILGVVGVWFSFPLIFVLAGIGTHQFLGALRRRDSATLGLASLTGIAWLASFGGCYLVSQAIVRKNQFLLDWWDYAFLPIPPRSFHDVARIFVQTVNLFIHPGDFWAPIGLFVTALLCLGLTILGIRGVEERRRGMAWLLLSPVPYVMFASALQEYPFQGRVVLFLIPPLYILVGQGIARLAGSFRGGTLVGTLLVAFFLARPVWDALWYNNIVARTHEFNAHGDLRIDLLDEMNFETKPPSPPSWDTSDRPRPTISDPPAH